MNQYRDVLLAVLAAGLVALIGHYCGRFLHWAEHRLTHQTIRPHALTPEPPAPQSFVPTRSNQLWDMAIQGRREYEAAYQQHLAAMQGRAYGPQISSISGNWFAQHAPNEEEFFRGAK